MKTMVEDVIGPKEELSLFSYIDVPSNHLLDIYTSIDECFSQYNQRTFSLQVRIRNCCIFSPRRAFISPCLGSGNIVDEVEERM